MADALSVAIATARSYLNDLTSSIWTTDAPLITMAQEAHRELQARLWQVGSPVVRAQSAEIAVTAGAVTLTSPNDILTPFKLVEYAPGQTVLNGVPMTEVSFIPQAVKVAVLNYWAWIDEAFQLLGATADRKVVIYYRKLIPIPAAAGDAIGIMFGELYLSARIAAFGHASLGNTDAAKLYMQMAESNFGLVVASQRGQQNPKSKP